MKICLLILTCIISEISSEADILNIGPCPMVISGSCPDERVRFHLYTRKDKSGDELLNVTGNLKETSFNASLPVKIIIHGYNSPFDISQLVKIRKDYLRTGSYNVIAVDWTSLSEGPCYLTSVHNIRFVGHCLGQLVRTLADAGSCDIHVIGFSLGAHVANYAANFLGHYKISRITGLDPAMPGFLTVPTSEKLDASDAKFVDVVHTNALMQGKLERSGHADFYVNGAVMQPGCGEDLGCSHHRSAEYFAESIASAKGFWGWRCPSYFRFLLGLCPSRGTPVVMGAHADPAVHGFFLLKTSERPPFALGHWDSEEKNEIERKRVKRQQEFLDVVAGKKFLLALGMREEDLQ